MKFYAFILGALAVWRVTHWLSLEDGPWNLAAALRGAAGPRLNGVLSCFYCLSLWIACPFALFLGDSWPERLLLALALSASAILAERATAQAAARSVPPYWEDPEVKDGLLRKEHEPTEAQ